MPMTERQKKQRDAWNKEHLKIITLAIHKEKITPYEEYAKKYGLTLAQTFVRLAEFQLGIRQRNFFEKLKFLFFTATR